MSHRQLHFRLNSNVGCLSLSLSEFEVSYFVRRKDDTRGEKLLGSINGDDLVLLFYELSLRSARSFDSSVYLKCGGLVGIVTYLEMSTP